MFVTSIGMIGELVSAFKPMRENSHGRMGDMNGMKEIFHQNPSHTIPHHDLMLGSYELFLGHHEFMMRFCAW